MWTDVEARGRPEPLNYQSPYVQKSLRAKLWPGAVLTVLFGLLSLLIPGIIYFLIDVESDPDALMGSEVVVVWVIIAFLAVGWVICVAWWVRAASRIQQQR